MVRPEMGSVEEKAEASQPAEIGILGSPGIVPHSHQFAHFPVEIGLIWIESTDVAGLCVEQLRIDLRGRV